MFAITMNDQHNPEIGR